MPYTTYQLFDEDDLFEEFVSTVESTGIAFTTILIPVYHSANPNAIQSERVKFEAFPQDFKALDDILESVVDKHREPLANFYEVAEMDDDALRDNYLNSYQEDKILFFLSKLELKNRGLELDEHVEDENREQIVNEVSAAKELSQNYVVFIYALGVAAIVVFFGLGIALGLLPALYIAYKGYEVAFNKVEMPNGEYTHEYDEKARFNGKSFLGIGVLLVCIWIAAMYLKTSE